MENRSGHARCLQGCDGRKKTGALLVPTTVLALQHYETFRDRMESFGVRVEVLSRFRSPAEIKKPLLTLKRGCGRGGRHASPLTKRHPV